MGLLMEASLREEMLEAVPELRAFAYSLTFSWDRADDLVQETVLRAWANKERFREGTNVRAWLFTILRNTFYSQYRKLKYEVSDDGSFASRLTVPPDQQEHVQFQDFSRAFLELPSRQREALLLVAAQGLSYDEAAQVCGVATGTLKSRVSRARAKLCQVLELRGTEDLGPDQFTRAAVQRI
jgi:RNA polymerase sigma-70 factor (ECF subfamily)